MAQYRTLLAQKRTELSQLQMGIVLVTIPVTIHAGVMVLADRHPLGVNLWAVWSVLVLMLAGGAALITWSARELLRTQRALGRLRVALNVGGWGTGLLTTPAPPGHAPASEQAPRSSAGSHH
ncbi:MAG: hypothetical protein QM767_02255 [Anaeromyxobacter sp.]